MVSPLPVVTTIDIFALQMQCRHDNELPSKRAFPDRHLERVRLSVFLKVRNPQTRSVQVFSNGCAVKHKFVLLSSLPLWRTLFFYPCRHLGRHNATYKEALILHGEGSPHSEAWAKAKQLYDSILADRQVNEELEALSVELHAK